MGADPVHKEMWIIADLLWERRKTDTLGNQGDREVRSLAKENLFLSSSGSI